MHISSHPRRIYYYALLVAIVLVLAVLGAYFYRFNSGLSHDSKDWADFGSYVGGMLGPAYAFMAFLLGLYTLHQTRQQNRRDELLKAIQGYERDFELCVTKPVTCRQPWIWGKPPSDSYEIKEVAFRTLLFNDGINWENHLKILANGLEFRVLSDGEVAQDRDIFLCAHLSLKGLFLYLELYRNADGDQSLVNYYETKYEVPRNRLSEVGMRPVTLPTQ